MQIFYAPRTISMAVLIAAEEAELEYSTVRLDFASAEQIKPDYLAVNPKGRVPAVALGDGILTETGAILEYIASQAPDAGLVPSDAADLAHMRAVMFYLASTMHVNHAHKMRGSRWATEQSSFDDMAAKVAQTMTESCKYVEDHCLRGTYVLGEQFSVADAYLYVVTTWLEGDGVDVSAFPRITAFRDAMRARPSVTHFSEQLQAY